jgi:hypothetical protein
VAQGVRAERHEPFTRALAGGLVFKSHLRFMIYDLRLRPNFNVQRKSQIVNRKS